MTTLETLRSHFGARYMTVLEGDRTDAAIMLELAELRRYEDELEEEIMEEFRDPESAVSRGYVVCVVGERSRPTAAYLERPSQLNERP